MKSLMEGFHKTFRGTIRKCENKNLSYIIFILIQLSEMHGVGRVNTFSKMLRENVL